MEGYTFILLMIGLGLSVLPAATSCCPSSSARSKPTPEKSAPYECGMPPVGDARERQSVKFYLVAMIFLLFDIEVAFLYPVGDRVSRPRASSGSGRSSRSSRCSSTGYIYVWRKGAFDWSGEAAMSARSTSARLRHGPSHG